MDRFGHTTYNLDFRNPTPADDPAPLFDVLRFYLDGSVDRTSGTDPHERQARSAAHRDEQTTAVLARLDPARRVVFARLLRWAQSTAPVREDALADIGLAWPQMRHMLTELGRRLTAAGTIDRPEDGYWLHPDDVLGRTAIPQGAVGQRQALWRGQRRVTRHRCCPRAPCSTAWRRSCPQCRSSRLGTSCAAPAPASDRSPQRPAS